MAVQRVKFLVHGTVQGVFFRVHTVEAAKKHGIAGFVQNLPNGKVAGEAQGEEEPLKLFLKEVEKGPPAAHVVRLDTEPLEVKEGAEGFKKVRWGDNPPS